MSRLLLLPWRLCVLAAKRLTIFSHNKSPFIKGLYLAPGFPVYKIIDERPEQTFAS